MNNQIQPPAAGKAAYPVSPRPWRIGIVSFREIWSADDCKVAETLPDNQLDKPYGFTPGNAAFIVRACNSHDMLVAALESFIACELSGDAALYLDQARAALAAAKEGAA